MTDRTALLETVIVKATCGEWFLLTCYFGAERQFLGKVSLGMREIVFIANLSSGLFFFVTALTSPGHLRQTAEKIICIFRHPLVHTSLRYCLLQTNFFFTIFVLALI